MKFSKLFHIFKDDQISSEDHLIFFDDFFNTLKRTEKTIRKFNLKRSLQRYRGGVKSVGEKDVISILSVLQYCFQQFDSSEACRKIVKQVEKELLYGKTDENSYISSSLDLYQLISKTKFHDTSILFNSLHVDECNIQTLVIEHKIHFNPDEWRKICWFEKHFSKSIELIIHELDFEEVLRLKYGKFQSVLSFKECSKTWLQISCQQIKDKAYRYDTAEILSQVEIIADKRHIPLIIDNEIKSLFQEYSHDQIQHVICFDVVKSVINNCIQTVIGINADQFHEENVDLCKRVFYSVNRRHGVNIEKIYFLHENSLNTYISEEIISRFSLRDAIETNSITTEIIYEWCAGSLCADAEKNDFSNACNTCFNTTVTKPLSIESFQLLQEWYLEIPIETQLLFESFINKESLRKSKTPEKYYQQRLEKLYGTYDVLLNLFNKNFIGIFQQANTNELLIDYKAIRSVFDITSSSGTTTSLSTGETKLKQRANDDLCYFNTYIKAHELLYKTVTHDTRKNVSLRQCHLILMLDNLVRLRKVGNPDRGEIRSDPMCTLPITLQGLPLDSFITDDWHLPECDGSLQCSCKNTEHLRPDDIKKVLLEPQNNEQTLYSQFFRLMTWGNKELWKKMPDDILVHLEGTTTQRARYDGGIESATSDEITEQLSDEESVDDAQNQTEDDIELSSVLNTILESETPELEVEGLADVYFSDDESELLTELEKSVDQLSILEDDTPEETYKAIQCLLSSFGFTKFTVPPLLCRHPPPATGRDDDITKIREILNDVLTKMGYTADESKHVNRILCGPDNKIGKCLLNLMESNTKYKAFLPEFPLLHLRKSKITILFSAYKDAGLVQLLKFMRDEAQEDWAKLVSIQHIDMATRHVKRIALSLHLAFVVMFAQTLGEEDFECFVNDLETEEPIKSSENWSEKFESYLDYGSRRNATFALHKDMMAHCDNVVAIALAERLGGSIGYELMLAAVKHSLLFSFVNNASSYAPYCVKLLFHHYSAGHFHRCMKHALFSTPIKTSTRNFACDTKREMDHLDALKGFRSGSNISSVTCRMSLVDSLNETRKKREFGDSQFGDADDDDKLGWELTDVDVNHIFPTTALILKRNGLTLEENDIPLNVYTKTPVILPKAILDECSNGVGKYLLMRYVANERLFQVTQSAIPSTDEMTGPQELISRARRSKGITIRRTLKSKIQPLKSENQLKEEKRQKSVAKETRKIDCLSSENNTCQALVKPDSTKPKVMKSLGMQRALKELLSFCITATTPTTKDINQYLQVNMMSVPKSVLATMKICTIEFAGVKFKVGNVKSGKEYLQFVESILKGVIRQSPVVSKVVVCEEKYSFTPDDLKASTRQQRRSKKETDVDHLKTGSSVLSEKCFKKDILTKSDDGKRLISCYLAENIQSLSFDENINIIIDSELHMTSCDCLGECACPKYCSPLLCEYDKNLGENNPSVKLLGNIRQSKGEAEMSVIDWLMGLNGELKEGESAVCIVTSGDIDAVYIHLYAVSRYWQRRQDGKFINPVFVVLQKPRSRLDIYDVTSMLELFEITFGDNRIGVKIAFALCIGGNDFIPKCHQISHDTVLKTVIQNPVYRENLFIFQGNQAQINKQYFIDLYRRLYCPKKHINTTISFNDVRALTIAKTIDQTQTSGYRTSDPRKWLPPMSAIGRLADLMQLQIQYLETVGVHDALLPRFLESSCLKKSSSGEIEYDFGPDAHFETISDLPDKTILPTRAKRHLDNTPQSGARRKRVLTSTPKH